MRNKIIYEPVFCSRSGGFQIAQATIDGCYIFTLWTFFPRSCFKEMSEQYRFIGNAVPSNRARSVFGEITTEELPYTEGYSFPIFRDDESAMAFLESELFQSTFTNGDPELPQPRVNIITLDN